MSQSVAEVVAFNVDTDKPGVWSGDLAMLLML